jgi:beta-glucanase (GH16 family)
MAINPLNLAATAKLTFADEFNTFQAWNGTSGWDTTWNYAPPQGMAPYNGEVQWYINPTYAPTASANPFSVKNGALDIKAAPAEAAIKPHIQDFQYTSGMITSFHTFSQTYGYFEMRAQLPGGQGFWPAFWLLPAEGTWPPELDIMEVLGNDPTQLYTTAHSGVPGAIKSTGDGHTVADMSAGFHTYGVDWQADKITWYFDGHQVFQTDTPAGMYKPMYMIANLAMGGGWAGSPDASTPFPAHMKIDYIHAYSAMPGGGGTTDTPVAPTPPGGSEATDGASTGGALPPGDGPTGSAGGSASDPGSVASGPPSDLPASAAWTRTFAGTPLADKLSGTPGADLIDGKAGIDTMTAGGGDDTYVVDTTRDAVVESAGGGTDTVRSLAGTYSLPAHVENGTAAGAGAQTLIGNALGNRLVAGPDGTVLKGGDGNDVIVAGGGADVLTGGAGKDTFVFKGLPSTWDHISDFVAGEDVLDLTGLAKLVGYTGTDGIADHALTLQQVSGGTLVFIDPDADKGPQLSVLVGLLDNVKASTLHPHVDYWFT